MFTWIMLLKGLFVKIHPSFAIRFQSVVQSSGAYRVFNRENFIVLNVGTGSLKTDNSFSARITRQPHQKHCRPQHLKLNCLLSFCYSTAL